MSRLGREKREQQGAVLAAAPLDVLVGPGGATVGGVPVGAVPGEEIQQTVLNHLHRIALATGHPVHVTVRDERIGYVVALLIERDGSSRFTAEPHRTAPPAGVGETAWPT
ncbi:MAG: tetratricopeptide repeat protein, partial [Streptomyces sp.]|nr:tetratricopeptide repeat protein [Streptomyces sp.]NUR66835.1 tetratricopeptide repeat protein [Streptomyces sp.]